MMTLESPYTPKDVREKPYTVEEMLNIKDEFSFIKGIVRMDITDIADDGFETFLDNLSEKLTGTDILMDISYRVVGHERNSVLIEVIGDASEILYNDAGEIGQEG
jgi:hypothetical protein